MQTTKNDSTIAEIIMQNFVEVDNANEAGFSYKGKWYSSRYGSDLLDWLMDSIAQALHRQREELVKSLRMERDKRPEGHFKYATSQPIISYELGRKDGRNLAVSELNKRLDELLK